MITAGIDLGSATGKVVIVKNGKILSWSVVRSTAKPEKTALAALEEALEKAGLKDISELENIMGTGYGRANVSFINDNMSEITCHARGANWLNPSARTVIDIGGQDCKIISLNDKGKVFEFAMNDKCAAGTGRFCEAMARTLDCTLDEFSELALKSDNPLMISKQCSVFAESEVISLINNDENLCDIAAGLIDSIARRIQAMAYRVGVVPEVVMTGGGARNKALKISLENKLCLPIADLNINPQIAGALGAALFAYDNATAK